MTIAYFCVLLNGILPIIWAGFAKKTLGFKMRDNANPREFLARATGAAQRANWAQQNAWEAFAPFAAAVLIAVQSGVSLETVNLCAVVFTLARVAYGVFYITNKDKLRSSVWMIGMAANMALYYFTWCQ